jgi:DNA-binding response OmpR family regulator
MTEQPRAPRILVVEDNADIVDIVQRRLRLDGMDPCVCTSGAEAKALLDRESFDAVLLDIMMPDVDGYEVLRHIRATPAMDELPVVMLTSKARREDVEKGHAMGADAYIIKPFGPHDLVRTLRRCLGKRTGAAPTAAAD